MRYISDCLEYIPTFGSHEQQQASGIKIGKINNEISSTKISRVCIYPTPPPGAVSKVRAVFELNISGWNSRFSFSQTGCYTKVKESSLSYY